MTKINKHQIFFIALSFVVLYVALSIQPEVLTSFNMENEKVGKIIIYSFLFFIGLIGVGHGALDGKIIWEHSKKISVKCKLYGVYILLVLLGAVLWVSSPFLGLSLLLLLSSVHFVVLRRLCRRRLVERRLLSAAIKLRRGRPPVRGRRG